MKRLELFCIIIGFLSLFILSCGDSEELNFIESNTNTIESVDKGYDTFTDSIDVVSKDIYSTVETTQHSLGQTWIVKYRIYTNNYHTNGYVLVNLVNILNSSDETDVLGVYSYEENPSNYITSIHSNLKFTKNDYQYSFDDTNNENTNVVREGISILRTAEDIIRGSFDSGSRVVDYDYVWNASIRQQYRKYGLIK